MTTKAFATLCMLGVLALLVPGGVQPTVAESQSVFFTALPPIPDRVRPPVASARTSTSQRVLYAAALLSSTTWQLVSTAHAPQARYIHGTAYDSSRHVTVLFGGDSTGSSRLNDTWEYDGTDWHLINTPQSPSGRVNLQSSMAYDSKRHRMVLFGGLTAAGYVNDTWEYDGSNWTLMAVTQSPAPRDAQAMAYDTKRNVVVLFGGHRAFGSAMNDTWEYDGVSWQQKSVTQAPPGRWYPPMVYDERRGVMVLFGGTATDTTQLNDTWEYDGTNWRQVITSQSPSPRSNHAMAYNSHTGETMLFGGVGVGNTLLTDTWQYDGASWQLVNTTQAPPARGATAMAYDSQRQKFVFFGGGYWFPGQPQPTLFGDTWELSATAGPTLSISHIEVTQAIQDAANSVPLIADKPTFVRVYVDCIANCTSVTGLLRGYGALGELAGSPRSPVNRSIIAEHVQDWTTQHGDLRKSLNYSLPLQWLSGTITLTAQIGITQTSEVMTFQEAKSPRVAIAPIRYAYGGVDRSPDSWTVQNGQWWANRVYPSSVQTVQLPGITWAGSCFGNYCNDPKAKDLKAKGLLLRLKLYLDWFNLGHLQQPAEQASYIFGWLPADTYGGGAAHPKLPSAFGDDHPVIGPQIFAHEVAHLLGRPHTKAGTAGSCGNPTPGEPSDWPYSDARIQEWGLDGRGFGYIVSSPDAVKDPNTTYDYMSYCWGEPDSLGRAWTSPHTYQQLYTQQFQIQSASIEAPLLTAQTYFIASGLVFTDNTAILDPIWTVPSTVTPVNPPVGSEYCLQTQDASNTVLSGHCFDLEFIQHDTGQAAYADGFSVILPYPSDVARIVLKKGATELAARSVSPNAPVVNILSPNGGESWTASGTYTVTWAASDVDNDPLTYSVLYSPDGSNWVPVGVAITETQVIVNAAELAGGNGAKVRVLATDGVNTSADESDAAFTVGSKGPQAFILAPEGNGTIPSGVPLFLQGYAYDLEDGTLGESALQWSSNLDGSLGAGSIILASLSPGQHIIMLTAMDSNSNAATASISVFVVPKVYLPLIRK